MLFGTNATNSTAINNGTPAPPFIPPAIVNDGDDDDSSQWAVGVIFVILASFLSTLGILAQKRALTIEDKRRQILVWSSGLSGMIVGAVLDLAAFGFAAQSLLAPLGGTTIVFNTLLSPCFLKEELYRTDIIAAATIVLGCTLTVVFGDQSKQDFTVDQLIEYYKRWDVVLYFVLIACALFIGFLCLHFMEKPFKIYLENQPEPDPDSCASEGAETSGREVTAEVTWVGGREVRDGEVINRRGGRRGGDPRVNNGAFGGYLMQTPLLTESPTYRSRRVRPGLRSVLHITSPSLGRHRSKSSERIISLSPTSPVASMNLSLSPVSKAKTANQGASSMDLSQDLDLEAADTSKETPPPRSPRFAPHISPLSPVADISTSPRGAHGSGTGAPPRSPSPLIADEHRGSKRNGERHREGKTETCASESTATEGSRSRRSADLDPDRPGRELLEFIPQQWHTLHAVLYAGMAGTVGAQSVLFGKTVAEFIKNAGDAFTSYQFYIVLLLMCFTLFLQLRFLNMGLCYHPALLIVPIYQTFWVIVSIFGGGVYFKEFQTFDAVGAAMFATGVLIALGGIFLLTTFRTKYEREKLEMMEAGSSSDEGGEKGEATEHSEEPTEWSVADGGRRKSRRRRASETTDSTVTAGNGDEHAPLSPRTRGRRRRERANPKQSTAHPNTDHVNPEISSRSTKQSAVVNENQFLDKNGEIYVVAI